MINVSIAEHAVAFPSKLVAQNGGEHIYNILLSKDTDNGSIIAKGDYITVDQYRDGGTVSGFSAKIVGKAANGNWYVEVVTAGNALLVYQQPLITEEWTAKFKSEKNFYNGKDEVTRAYALHAGDIFEVSASAFSNPAAVAANKTISSVAATGKMTVAS